MSESKHTPGPMVHDEQSPFNVYSDDRTGSIVATTDGFEYAPRPDHEKAANAARIVLTWNCHDDLLEALKELRDAFKVVSDDDWQHPSYRVALSAIAKAEGRS